MDAKTIGEALAAKRTELGMEKGQAAQRIGMSRTTYSSYEQDAQRPSVEVFPAIAEFLGASMDEVLTLYGATCIVQARNFLSRVSEKGSDQGIESADEKRSALIVDEPPMDHFVTQGTGHSDSAHVNEAPISAITGDGVSDKSAEMVDVLSEVPTSSPTRDDSGDQKASVPKKKKKKKKKKP